MAAAAAPDELSVADGGGEVVQRPTVAASARPTFRPGAEIRADAVAAGGDPDGPETTAWLREAAADARSALPPNDRAAYDALIDQLRAGPAGGRAGRGLQG